MNPTKVHRGQQTTFFQQLLWLSFSFPCYLLGNQARRCCRMSLSLVCRMWGFNLHNIKPRENKAEQNSAQSYFISGGLLLFCLCFPAVSDLITKLIFFCKCLPETEGPRTHWCGRSPLSLHCQCVVDQPRWDKIFSRQLDPSLPSLLSLLSWCLHFIRRFWNQTFTWKLSFLDAITSLAVEFTE